MHTVHTRHKNEEKMNYNKPMTATEYLAITTRH